MSLFLEINQNPAYIYALILLEIYSFITSFESYFIFV